MAYRSSKVFGPFSACFRQPGADSHCRLLHGYGLTFKLTFEADYLDDNNWVIDFGGLKEVKLILENTFDHKLIVANDDPQVKLMLELGSKGVADVTGLPAVGCEAFA